MALGAKTLDAAGILLAVGGEKTGTPQQIEDMVDAITTMETTAADITSVVAGAGMTGGGTSGAVTLNVIAGANITVAADAVSVSDAPDFTGAVTINGDTLVAARLLSVGPIAAKDTDIVHAIFDGVTPFPGPFTNPVSPRNLTVTFAAAWDGGDVTVVGTNQFDEAVSEVFADVAESTVVGVKIFKTVTSATKQTPAGDTGDGASIGTGDKVGLPIHIADTAGLLYVGTTIEAATFDATYDAFTPTTTPAATTFIAHVNVNLSAQ